MSIHDPHEVDDPVAAHQAWQNRTTQHQWGFYDSHRRALEALIVPPMRGGRICILGAGNCNDLDLRWLTEVYREVHLVDLDSAALETAARRQKVESHPAIHRHAPIDLTGIATVVARWADITPTVEVIQRATQKVLEIPVYPWGKFEMVLSPCVLTQTMNPVRNALRDKYPPSHPARLAIRAALRLRHLRTIAALISTTGRGVLAIDLISTEKFADLPRVPREQLDDLMRTFVNDGRHYPGLDPASLTAVWRGDGSLSSHLTPPQFSPPWLWHLGLCKSFLVYAATFQGIGP